MLFKMTSKLSKSELTISFVRSNYKIQQQTCPKVPKKELRTVLSFEAWGSWARSLLRALSNGRSWPPVPIQDSENLLHLWLGISISTRPQAHEGQRKHRAHLQALSTAPGSEQILRKHTDARRVMGTPGSCMPNPLLKAHSAGTSRSAPHLHPSLKGHDDQNTAH